MNTSNKDALSAPMPEIFLNSPISGYRRLSSLSSALANSWA